MPLDVRSHSPVEFVEDFRACQSVQRTCAGDSVVPRTVRHDLPSAIGCAPDRSFYSPVVQDMQWPRLVDDGKSIGAYVCLNIACRNERSRKINHVHTMILDGLRRVLSRVGKACELVCHFVR